MHLTWRCWFKLFGSRSSSSPESPALSPAAEDSGFSIPGIRILGHLGMPQRKLLRNLASMVSRGESLVIRFFIIPIRETSRLSRAADSWRQTRTRNGFSCHAPRHHRENDDYREGYVPRVHVSISHRLFPLNNKFARYTGCDELAELPAPDREKRRRTKDCDQRCAIATRLPRSRDQM